MRFVVFIFLLAVPFSARAACTSPAGAESQTRYDFSSHKMYYCNGTNWIESSAPIGAMTNNKWCRGTGTQIICDQDAPSGGGALSCTVRSASSMGSVSISCDGYGIRTGGGCISDNTTSGTILNNHPHLTNSNSWYCRWGFSSMITGYAVCCSID